MPGEIFVQRDLAATLRKLVEAEQRALKAGRSRKEAIYAAYDRFYKGDIARELVRGVQEEGGLFTLEDLANWKVASKSLEYDVQGYPGLQASHLAAGTRDAAGPEYSGAGRSEGHGLQLSEVHPHPLSGDEPGLCRSGLLLRRSVHAPEEPVEGLLSKEYAKARFAGIDWAPERLDCQAGRSICVSEGRESVRDQCSPLDRCCGAGHTPKSGRQDRPVAPQRSSLEDSAFKAAFFPGTTTIEAADEEGGSFRSLPVEAGFRR